MIPQFYFNFKGKEYYFKNPVKTLILNNSKNLTRFFSEIDRLRRKYFVAGFLSYELGYLLEKKLKKHLKNPKFPLALFAAYKRYENKKRIKCSEKYSIKHLEINETKKNYIKNIKKIKKFLKNGETYQINYTIKYKFFFSGDYFKFFKDLEEKQNADYNAFIKFGNKYILSLSPELFFFKNKRTITVKPMKGTIERGKNLSEDRTNKNCLKKDLKNRSENVMIVDLLRNDLGKISEEKSVKVKKLFEIEKYTTLFQMTSTIHSSLKKRISLYKLIKAIFPSGSITGAPKIRSMEIIRKIEKEDRKIYTGSIGFFTPEDRAIFNVSIRTILIENNIGEMGIGSGIVIDSDEHKEFEECKLKANFLTLNRKDFKIIETILFKNKFFNLNEHLERMEKSAKYFDFKFNKKSILKELFKKSRALKGNFKFRILLNKTGKIETEFLPINFPKVFRIKFSKFKTDPENIFLYHKTTNRNLYKKELEKAKKEGFFDVIFTNKYGEITEGAITNIYIEKNKKIYTPKIKSGLLNGIIRKKLLLKGKITEKVITFKDLKTADNIYISNSIIGLKKAILIL